MNSLKNTLIRCFLPHPTNRSELGVAPRILVVSTTAMGDTLWATPALSNLRLHFPKAYIAVLTSPTGREILENNPHLDQIILLKEPLLPRLLSMTKTLKREKFDVALIMHISQRLVLPLCSFSRIPRIIGTKGINKGLDDLLTDPLDARFEHEIERRQKILDRLNVPQTVQTLSYYVQPQERIAAREYIASASTRNQPLIAIHPGSKDVFRRWPADCFVAVACALQKKFGCEIFLTGSPSERRLLQKIGQRIPNSQIICSSSIRFLAAVIEQMDLVLSNDTGPMHLACALNRPTIGIYVPTDPRICGPHAATCATVIYREPTCQPCMKRRCRDSFCFLQIGTQEVIEACSKTLESLKKNAVSQNFDLDR